MFEAIESTVRRLVKKANLWLIKKTCSPSEWKTLRMVRAGYYEPIPITTTFEVTKKDHQLLKENQGKRFDERFCISRQLLRTCEEEIAKHIGYECAYDPKSNVYVYSAELKVLEV